MESIERTGSVDITLRKVFDMKMKQGHEMRKAHIDETEFLRTFYFLKGTRLFMIDISTKKIEEMEFTKGKEIIYISGNMNCEFLIIITKNGNIYALDNNHNIKYIKNLIVNTSSYDKKKNNNNMFKMFSSHNLDKLIIANETFMTIWYRSETNLIKQKNEKNYLEELSGTYYNISIEKEKRTLLSEKDFSSKYYFESLSAVFGNNYFLGSYSRVIYLILSPTDLPNSYKIHLIDYLFRYENCNKFKMISSDKENTSFLNNQYVKNIEKKIIYSFIDYSESASKENEIYITNKERIIQKFNVTGNCCAIMINCQYSLNSTLMFYMTETMRVSTYKTYEIFSKLKNRIDISRAFIWVDDLDWICDDLFLVIIFSQGYIVIINLNFQIVKYVDTTGSLISPSNDILFCPSYLYNQNTKHSDQLYLLTSKKRTDYFTIYSPFFSICFQTNYRNYESKLVVLNNTNETFEDFLFMIKYFQIHHHENDGTGLFDKIHNYMLKSLKELYHHTDTENTMPNENLSHIFSIFVKFIRIFRSLNQIHETNLTILSYLIGVSNDFFYHLINFKEIWLAFVFIDICENYLLKHLRIKSSRNKLDDDQIIKGQTSYMTFNPYYSHNPSIKCYNKIFNKVLHSRLRLILIFFALIEFRNNQALNINVLYFALAKLCIEKLKKNNLLEDIQLIVKIVIRNWKYLKVENSRVGGEEYILNSLTMNYRTEILSQYIVQKTPRDDIKFEFFAEFLPLEGLHEFTELHEAYCRGEEESLVNEYNYINNIGIIQRWVLFFTNYFYNFMFEDIRNYIDNHVKQTILKHKEIENISPEEHSLSSLIYFNFTFYHLVLNNHLKFFLKMVTVKSKESNEENFTIEDQNIIAAYNNIFMPFISALDVPFIIFEFYQTEDNKMKKNLPYEINEVLNTNIINYMKTFNFSLNDTFDFIDFLMQNGFRNYLEEEENLENKFIGEINKIQKYTFSGFLFYLFVTHKLNQIHLFDIDNHLILSILDTLCLSLKSEALDFLFIILIGHLRYYISSGYSSTLTYNDNYYFEIVQNLLKTLYMKVLKEEPNYIKRNLYDILSITPKLLRNYLLEASLFYEIKKFKKDHIEKLYDLTDVLAIENFLFDKKSSIFDQFTKESKSQIFEIIFNSDYKEFQFIFKNLLFLLKSSKKDSTGCEIPCLIYVFNKKINEIKSDLIEHSNKFKNEIVQEDNNSNLLLYIMITKLLTLNINESDANTILNIKTQIIKILNIFTLINIKYKSLSQIDPQQDILNYLKTITLCLIYSKKRECTFEYVLDYLSTFSYSNITEVEHKEILTIIENLNFYSIKLVINLDELNQFKTLKERLKEENEVLLNDVLNILKESDTIKVLFESVKSSQSNNMKTMFLLINSEMFISHLIETVNEMNYFIKNLNSDLPMRNARKRYLKLSESFHNLTGVPVKNFMYFNENWQIVDEEELFKFIVKDDFELTKFCQNEQTNFFNSTSRKHKIKLVPLKENQINIESLKYKNSSNYIEPNMSDIPQFREEVQNESELKLVTNSTNIKKPAGILLRVITNIFFKQFKSILFNEYKERVKSKELEEIKIYSINVKEGVVDSITLKEKYITNGEIEKNLNLNSSLISENKKLAENLNETSVKENSEFNILKPFDVININKFKMGKAEESVLYKNLQNSRKKDIQSNIKNKLDEISTKLKHFEEIAMNLEKEFSHYNNK